MLVKVEHKKYGFMLTCIAGSCAEHFHEGYILFYYPFKCVKR